jgi:hypothetical protein
MKLGIWEREYLNRRIDELKIFLENKKELDEVYFLARKLLELYEFVMRYDNSKA